MKFVNNINGCAFFLNFFVSLFFLNMTQALGSEPVWTTVGELSLFPELSQNQNFFDETKSSQGSLFLFANERATATEEDFSFEIEPELRILGESGNISLNDRGTIFPPKRLLNLDWELGSNPRTTSVIGFERLNLAWHSEDGEISLGRKPVSLGVLSIFPVWNKFTRPLITVFGPLRVYSEDQASFHWQSGRWTIQALDIEQEKSSGAARIIEGAWLGNGLEIHILGASWWQSGAVGLAAVKDIAGISLKLEGISFSADGLQAGLGTERAFNEFWSGLVEFLYLQSGASDKSQYLTLAPSLFRPLTAKDYGYFRLEYKPWPLWIFQAGDLVNLVDGSNLVNIKTIYSLSNELELNFEFRLPVGESTSELSPRTLPIQALAGLHFSF